jgi:hypothetical protein
MFTPTPLGTITTRRWSFSSSHSPHRWQDMARKDLVNRSVDRLVPTGKDNHHVQIWKKDLCVFRDSLSQLRGQAEKSANARKEGVWAFVPEVTTMAEYDRFHNGAGQGGDDGRTGNRPNRIVVAP